MRTDIEKKITIGLTDKEVDEKTAAGLVNGDFDVKTKSYKKIITDNIFSLFNLVNTILVIGIIAVGSWKNALFFLVVIWNFLIGCVQEIKAKKTIEKLSLLSAPKAHVLRNGELKEIRVKDIVLGDICCLKNGYQICADAVVLDGECQVNESLLTGESTPIPKKQGDHLLSGSFLVSGKVFAEVEHIGQDNYVNKITAGAKYLKKSNSVIMKSVKSIVKVIAIAMIPMAALFVWKNFFLIDQSVQSAMVKVVAAISAMIPGGLVLLVSVVLAVSVIRLGMHRTLVQDLYCVENLARVDVLCLDKTGTITEGVLKLEEIVEINEDADTEPAIKEFAFKMDDENSTLNAVRTYFGIGEKELMPDTGAKTIPFSSETKWSGLYVKGQGTFLLGAPDFLISDINRSYGELISQYAELGKRVVLFAKSSCLPRNREGLEAEDGKNLPSDIRPLAFLVIGDSIRKTAKDTFRYFREQDVDIKVISGDNPQTVSKVAEEAGLEKADRWVDATTLTTYEEIEDAVDRFVIFGRVTPYQKLDIVKALKAHGHVVAMTGDGANDVLALKEADCSIAMQSGSEAARNVSNIVLLDSDFSSLPLVVAEGRKSINNLQRSAALYLTKTTYAFLLAIIFLFVAFAYPFESIQTTLIGACTIGIPSFFLALEPNKTRIRKHFLWNVFVKAVPSGVMTAAAIIVTTLIAVNSAGVSAAQVSTVATIIALTAGFIVVFNISGKMTLWKWLLLVLIVAIAAGAFLVLPTLFDLVPLNSYLIMVVIITAAVFFAVHTLIFRGIFPRIDKEK